jgi:membrane protein
MRRLGLFLVAVGQRFYDDQCLMRASALAYTSLLSIVPLFAVMFSVLKGLGVQHRLEPVLLSRLSLSQETTDSIIGYIDRINVSTLGALGAVALLLTVVSVLGSIEASLNNIWRVTAGRTVWRKITDYLSVVLLTPFLLLAGVAITSSMQMQRVLDWLLGIQYVGVAVTECLSILPVVMNALAIGMLYAVMPNRRQAPLAVILGALVAGAAWQTVQWAYIKLQIGFANYNAIYGALSQLPVTLVWLYVSWAVVLAGAELAAVYELGAAAAGLGFVPVNQAVIALEVLLRGARAFAGAGGSIDPLAVARALGVDAGVVASITDSLVRRGWLAAADGDGRRYVLARDPASIELGALLEAQDDWGVPSGSDPRVQRFLQAMRAAERRAWATWRLADMLKPNTTDAGAEPR